MLVYVFIFSSSVFSFLIVVEVVVGICLGFGIVSSFYKYCLHEWRANGCA